MDEFNSDKNGLNNENGEIPVNEVQVDNIKASETAAASENVSRSSVEIVRSVMFPYFTLWFTPCQ